MEVWTAVTGPVDRDPVAGPRTVTIPASGTVTRTLTQAVPGNAPGGLYTYSVQVGVFPGTVLSSDAFTFEKLESLSDRPSAEASDWTVSGWDDAAALATATAPAEVGAYPNPFAASTTIRFSLDAPSDVRLAVYDVLGREVAVLVDGAVEAGTHTAEFDAAGLPSGLYLYRLSTGGRVYPGQLTVLR